MENEFEIMIQSQWSKKRIMKTLSIDHDTFVKWFCNYYDKLQKEKLTGKTAQMKEYFDELWIKITHIIDMIHSEKDFHIRFGLEMYLEDLTAKYSQTTLYDEIPNTEDRIPPAISSDNRTNTSPTTLL